MGLAWQETRPKYIYCYFKIFARVYFREIFLYIKPSRNSKIYFVVKLMRFLKLANIIMSFNAIRENCRNYSTCRGFIYLYNISRG